MVGATALLVAAVVAPATSDLRTGQRALVPARETFVAVATPDVVGEVAIEVRPGVRRYRAPSLSVDGAPTSASPFALVAGLTGERGGRGAGAADRRGRFATSSSLTIAGEGPVVFAGPPSVTAVGPAAPAAPGVDSVVPAPEVSSTTAVEPLPSPRASVRAAGAGTRTAGGVRGRAANVVVAIAKAATAASHGAATPASVSRQLPATAAATARDAPGAAHRTTR